MRGVRFPLNVNLHSRTREKPGGKFGVRETARGCERRQLFPPLLSRQCCYDTQGFCIVGMRYFLCISEYRRKMRRLILDTCSGISILQPGVSRSDVSITNLKPYGVTGEALDIKG